MGTTTFKRSLLVDTQMMGIITDCLGANTTDFSSATDVGKGVKLGAAAYVPLTVGDEIEGIVTSVENGTRNGGYSWGGIQTKGRAEAVVDAAQTPAMAVGDYVCSGTPTALGTAGAIKVLSSGTGYVAPTKFLWRVISLGSAGTGAVGTTVIIERA